MEKYEKIMPILLTLALGVLILDFGLAMIEHYSYKEQQETGGIIREKPPQTEGVCSCE